MNTKLSFLCSLLMFLGVCAFTNCGNDEHVAEFDTEAQGSPEDVSLLLRRLQYGYQEDNDSLEGDSIFEGWEPDRFERDWIDRSKDPSIYETIHKAEVRAVARLSKSFYESFDGKLCCFLSEYNDYKDKDYELAHIFCPIPANAPKEQFAIGSTISFRCIRLTYRLPIHFMRLPNELIAEIELVEGDNTTE